MATALCGAVNGRLKPPPARIIAKATTTTATATITGPIELPPP